MDNIEQIKAALSYTVFTMSDQAITLGKLLLIPMVLFFGVLLTKWFVRFITKRLTNKKTDPNIIHLLQRVLYIIAIAIIVITSLDLINVPITAFAFLSGCYCYWVLVSAHRTLLTTLSVVGY